MGNILVQIDSLIADSSVTGMCAQYNLQMRQFGQLLDGAGNLMTAQRTGLESMIQKVETTAITDGVDDMNDADIPNLADLSASLNVIEDAAACPGIEDLLGASGAAAVDYASSLAGFELSNLELLAAMPQAIISETIKGAEALAIGAINGALNPILSGVSGGLEALNKTMGTFGVLDGLAQMEAMLACIAESCGSPGSVPGFGSGPLALADFIRDELALKDDDTFDFNKIMGGADQSKIDAMTSFNDTKDQLLAIAIPPLPEPPTVPSPPSAAPKPPAGPWW